MIKKILLTIFLFITFCEASFCEEEKTPIRFIYINGANNNTQKMENWFYSGIKKAHPKIKQTFEKDKFTKQHLLSDKYIEKEPGIFFWGDKTSEELKKIDTSLSQLKVFSPKLAQTFRTLFAHFMLDAIWVQKEHNMQRIVKELHNEVMQYSKNGEKVMLFGYSAGSFVTYRYMFYKLPAITQNDFISRLKADGEDTTFIEKNSIKPTCIDAVTSANLAVYAASGRLLYNQNKEIFEEGYRNLDKYTEQMCIPEGTLVGTVNYASPLALFYPDLIDQTIEINIYNKYLYQYLVNNNIFWLTVNFADDPLGYPLTENPTREKLDNIYNFDFDKDGRGFTYEKSNVKSPAIFLMAHTSYWKYAKKFAKAITEGYKEGFINFNTDVDNPD